MSKYRFKYYEHDAEGWVVTILYEDNPIFMASNLESELVANTYGRAFISGCEFTRGALCTIKH